MIEMTVDDYYELPLTVTKAMRLNIPKAMAEAFDIKAGDVLLVLIPKDRELFKHREHPN